MGASPLDRVRVSDRALVRYMERVLNIDVEQLRAIIAESCTRHQGAPCVRVLGARFLVVDGLVVTTIANDKVPSYQLLARLLREAGGEA